MSDNPIVYSTEQGRIMPEKNTKPHPKGDGIIRISRQTLGRKGKGVCVIEGFDLDDCQLQKLAADLKKRCGCGGSVKNRKIEIQGDKRDLLKALIEDRGFKVKLAGG
ncbi:stress response translation initiation inhibitor YciH [Gilliamella apicola]|uniref:Stress response translation initiation inhibitor YciH n=1 Tax=Gilliamella apicola TaxID=1196095 RepID=A0A556RK34_9GAMM|nr:MULTISPECIES: stress response translation initiation inhibitor YciH [unclassified Gilliamella]OTQ73118.1 translation initiation factor [Gilliamella sp. N-G2]OTQ79902.1 translation initiation factor [Gilliamella sp. N-W3]TSJ89253.1 stress response translation initiation inhibitor YciH [Gilliamella apicola]